MYYAILFIFVHYYLGKILKFVFCALFDSVGFIKKTTRYFVISQILCNTRRSGAVGVFRMMHTVKIIAYAKIKCCHMLSSIVFHQYIIQHTVTLNKLNY